METLKELLKHLTGIINFLIAINVYIDTNSLILSISFFIFWHCTDIFIKSVFKNKN